MKNKFMPYRPAVIQLGVRNLVLVLGDQLNRDSAAFDGFDSRQDVVWMAEAAEEAQHVWSHKARIVLFLSAMRHFRDALLREGFCVEYLALDSNGGARSLAEALAASVGRLGPVRLIVVEPGEWRVEQALREAAVRLGLPLEIRPDRHFYCSREEFAGYVRERRALRLEFFYREQRRKHGVLMAGRDPEGGRWNFDAANRESFGKDGPGAVPRPRRFAPDGLTAAVVRLVEERFAEHPGDLDTFAWPVTREQALEALDDFIMHRLPQFGAHQDAMWTGEPFLSHSLLSAALNLKLLDPREVVSAAELAYRDGYAPLAAVEGFIRQILGWREYVRGIYWTFMPEYLCGNHLDARQPLPGFYWTGDTRMACVREVVRQTLRYGYAHHIQRLMVTGLFALLLGVRPEEVHRWYLAVYVDAVEWVELPNTLGMAQYADGGVMASKPYAASGKYIQRMSNYCHGCAFRPEKAAGADACPFTTLYWDFLMRHEPRLRANPRMRPQINNLARLDGALRQAIQEQAARIREECRQAPPAPVLG